MHKLVVTYKNPENPEAFDKYYHDTHIPLANKVPKVKEIRINKVFGSPTGKADLYLIAELCFENKEDFKAGLNSPEMAATGEDLQNFAVGLASLYFVEEK